MGKITLSFHELESLLHRAIIYANGLNEWNGECTIRDADELVGQIRSELEFKEKNWVK